MDPKEYKEFHESFMKDNNGSTIAEVFITIVPSYFVTFISVNLFTIISTAAPIQFLWEFFVLVVSVILNVTVLNVKIWEITFGMGVVIAIAAGRQLSNRAYLIPFLHIPYRRPEYVAILRATTNLLTAICILAVDFQCFPRKLAKTELFGFGLMDTGVGLYVYSNGIVDGLSRRSHRLSTEKLYKLVLNTSPLIALGMARFFATNEIDYQQHISEYGVHWNFFMTLAATKFLGTIIVALLWKVQHSKYAAAIVVTGHQMALHRGLTKWVNNDQLGRDTFLHANREGIVSIPGYVGLYLACVFIGTALKSENPVKIPAKQLLIKAIQMAIHGMVLWKISYDCHNIFGCSRRLANMGYVLWILSIATLLTSLFMMLEVFHHVLYFDRIRMAGGDGRDEDGDDVDDCSSKYCPLILDAINYNALAFFLGANVLTGVVNLTFQTMLVNPTGCVIILAVYMFVLCAISTFLFVNKIQIKFW